MTITQAFLTSEISTLWPDNSIGEVTPANARTTLNDIVTAIFQGINPVGLSTANIWTASQAFNAGITITTPTDLTQGINITQLPIGTVSSPPLLLNNISIQDGATVSGSNFSVGLNVTHSFGGSSTQGGREAIQGTANLNVTTSASSGNRNYVGVVGIGQTIVNDNGTNPASSATSAGAFFGGNFVGAILNSAATALLNVTGAEFNVTMITGSSAWAKSLAQFSSMTTDRVQGTVVDAMLWLYNQSALSPGWDTGILFDNTGGIGAWPIKSTGTIIKTGGNGTAANGIDFTNTTFTGCAFKSAIGGANPTTPPTQTTPVSQSIAVGGSYADSSSGSIYQLSSWADNTGTRNTVAVFGQGRALAVSGRAWGGNFVGYAGNTGAFAQAVEIDYGVTNGISFQQAWGLALNVGGNTAGGATNTTIGINFDSLGAGGTVTNAIRFNNAGLAQPYTNALILAGNDGGAITAPLGLDFSSANFGTAALKTKGFTVSPSGLTTIAATGTSGVQATSIATVQSQPNTTDTADAAMSLNYVLSANSAVNELVCRAMSIALTNTLTGGGTLQNARVIDLTTVTNAGTATTNLECLYLEAGTSSGTVTTGYGLHIASIQGSTKWGIADDSGSNWYNATGGLSLGSSTVPTSMFLRLAAATTAKSQINFISSSGTNPTSPNDGDMWYDGTNLNFRFGGSTKTITHS